MDTERYTRTDVGMVWGWRMISPLWRTGNLWGIDATLPLDYDTPLMEKVVVLMTDGENRPSGITATADANLTQTCTDMKALGIIIYTIGFDVPEGGNVDLLLQGCATDAQHHFLSATGDDLETAFNIIGSELSNLRLAE